MWFQKQNVDIICIGSASKDIFFPTDEGVVIDTPDDITSKQKIAFELGGKYRIKDRFEAIGGVAANVASGLARLGQRVAVYSCIGGDEVGKSLKKDLEKEGIATNLLHCYQDAKTDLSAIIVLMESGDRTIFHNRDANERLNVTEEKLATAPWVFVSALNGDWKKNLATILSAKKKYGFSLALNPGQHNIKDDAQLIFETLPLVDLLLLNKDEAIELLIHATPRPTDTELDNERFLLEKLFANGPKIIGLTDGKNGAWSYDGTTYWQCPIYTKTSVVDSTGAGDAFGSGFFAAHRAGYPIEKALQYGIANSGSVIGFYGAIQGLLTSTEIEALMKNIVPRRLE